MTVIFASTCWAFGRRAIVTDVIVGFLLALLRLSRLHQAAHLVAARRAARTPPLGPAMESLTALLNGLRLRCSR